ncbi:M48 family metallopeptidase [Pedomonas mirosovicensis]|uniref:M48 family metallopeptidase n=1 Tax=Pedomonas mirosovicensis TaxID=2908641 RepID=UPI002167471F|nr:M48 family metallopeptidase [Pedomonas mirosovicensis]MCH8684492.1 M48 family metallopeptidase [Pedomonas mirosovicensis]
MQRPILWVGAALFLSALSLPVAGSQAAAPQAAGPGITATEATDVAAPPAAEAAAPAPAFDVELETQRYLATVSGEARAKSDAYFEGGYWMLLWGTLWALAVAWVLLRFGISARVRGWMEARTKRRWLQNLGYAAVYLVLATLLSLPWTLYESFFREHQYGLSNQSFGGWLRDFSISEVVNLVLLAPALAVLYAIIRRAQRTWWVWGAGLAVVLIAFASFIAPVFIQPLFNSYTPLAEGPVHEQVLSMARANGVPADNVYVVDASRQTSRISANVSGLGSTIRISLNDNLLNQGSPEEIKAVMGHELGHYVLDHSLFLLMSFGLVFAAGFAFVHFGLKWLIARHGERWGVRGLDDIAGLPALIAVLSVFFFLATPVTNTITRTAETQADIFGLNAAREPDGFATTALKLSTYRKLNPSPLEEIIFFDHPSGASRIRMSMRWKAENLSAPPPADTTAVGMAQ